MEKDIQRKNEKVARKEWKGKGDEEERGGGVWMWKDDGVEYSRHS